MDEIDAIGGKRFSEGTSADREIQRTLMELLNQMDGFDRLGQVKMIMATNRPDVLDPALLRPGRLDRKIGAPPRNEATYRRTLTHTLKNLFSWIEHHSTPVALYPAFPIPRFFLLASMKIKIFRTSG